MHYFAGRRINFVQVGLGTNSTFIQNLAGEPWEADKQLWSLLKLTSETDPSLVTGISVEPVESLVSQYELYMDKLPNVSLLQAALGESDIEDADMHVFTSHMYEDVMRQVAPARREGLGYHMEYLLNMSKVGRAHPYMESCLKHIRAKYKVDVCVKQQKSEIWTWGRLAETLNFKGCEVLVVDTEGHDTAILRSLIQHCQQHEDEWPNFIQFESMGLCDDQEGKGAEKKMVRELERHGYIAVMISDWNTYVVHESAMSCPKIKKWVGSWYCDVCRKYGAPMPFTSDKKQNYCALCSNIPTTLERGSRLGQAGKCKHPDCNYRQNSDVAIAYGYCCEKCEGLHKNEPWAQGGRRHYKSCERIPAG